MDPSAVTLFHRDMDNILKRQRRSVCDDIISDLPEDIIGRILSFLPTKEAVRTSLLSKKWIYMWTFITDLHFTDRPSLISTKKAFRKDFVNFVSRVLHYLNVSTIQSFSLRIRREYDSSIVDSWISAILGQGVKKISVFSTKKLSLSFHSLFKCKSLEEFELKMRGCVIRVPSFVSLPYLRVLQLSEITFTGDLTSNSQEMSLSFPVLKKFETKNCTWSCVTFSVPLLESISITYHLHPPVVHNSVIKFGVTRLKEFTYCGDIMRDTIILDPSGTHNAAANISLMQLKTERLKERFFRSYMLLQQFNQVKYLKLNVEEVHHTTNIYLANLPTFRMLSHLELDMINVENLLRLLEKTPFLKTLLFRGVSVFDEEILNSTIVPNCLLSTLEVIKFRNFHGYEYELCLAKFVVENAVFLKRMDFFAAGKLQYFNGPMDGVIKKLFSFKKASASAIIDFFKFVGPFRYRSIFTRTDVTF